jgi:2-oxoglutarate ferredoxin oxidoreductase subunit beta
LSRGEESRDQLLKAALKHRGLALVDVISPCVTFNDHEGSTKSYLYTRRHERPIAQADLVPPAEEIQAPIGPKGVTTITMHDGSRVRFSAVPEGYDPRNRAIVLQYLQEQQTQGVIPTGLLFLDESVPDMHEMNNTSDTPLVQVPFESLCPGSAALEKLMEDFR